MNTNYNNLFNLFINSRPNYFQVMKHDTEETVGRIYQQIINDHRIYLYH